MRGQEAIGLTRLSGWGGTHHAECDYRQPEVPDQVGAWLDRGGTIPRGLGRSYGDAAVNGARRVLGLTRLDRYLGFDETTGRLTCESGVSLAQIIRDFTPRGWFPLITPGTKYVTIGGCVANDIHGKAHHDQGSFAASVCELTVLLASGEVVVASREHHPDLFWACFGGMGLLGIVLTVTLQLRRVETSYFQQQAIVAGSLEAMMDALDDQGEAFPYSVATIDIFATGRRLGRGILNVGDHAPPSALPRALQAAPLRLGGPPRVSVPFELPGITLNRLSMRAVNGLIQAIQARRGPIAHYEPFVFPLDFVGHWNRGYGRRGFTQYQFVVPFDEGRKHIRGVLEVIHASGELPFLNVLKRLGPESKGLLSFPRPGYTFAIDFPVRRNTATLLRQLDERVLEAGGRVYLGKDAFLDAPTFRAMYPAIDEFLEIKAKYDPEGLFTSDLARRVGLA